MRNRRESAAREALDVTHACRGDDCYPLALSGYLYSRFEMPDSAKAMVRRAQRI